MKTLMKFISIIIIHSFLLSFGCGDNSTEPETEQQVIPLDGRGGGVIFYCYQPLQNGIH
jgi:hypothetical protein